MAGSRVQKVGSVFSRTRDLMRMGVLRQPLWFEVYAACPPRREPRHRQARPRYGRARDSVRDILYPEDAVRAKFYRVYGSGPRPFDLSQLNYKSTCQRSAKQNVVCESKNTILKSRFVEKYNELKEEGKIEEEKLFEETGKALLASGIILQRRGTDKVTQQSHQDAEARDSVLHQQLQSVLEEMQAKKKDVEEQKPELTEAQKESPVS
ncbi:small ribosomal subunit protein mS23 isoform X1 [Anas acuta]|uniref:small ribosomal subunit protein mS23 isoform X1 n=2 Tax=Anas acuta TaxID=28680 RepID=UPI0035C8D690